MKPTGKAIAEALGVSPGRVSQLAREGLPRDSLEEAERWYRRRVNQVRSAGQRLAREGRSAPPRPRADAGNDVLSQVRAAADAALASLSTSGAMTTAEEARLRAALAAVPAHLRASVELPVELINALAAEVLELVREFEPARPAGSPAPVVDDGDRESFAEFWFAVLAGKIRVLPMAGAAG